MRVSATVAPAGETKGPRPATRPNVILDEVAVVTVQGQPQPGIESICVIDGRLFVSMGTWGIIINPIVDKKSLKIDVTSMPSTATGDHPLLRGECKHHGITAIISSDGVNATLKQGDTPPDQ